jgi:NAD(P)H-quinone oxidoreductase subunit 5
MPSPSSESALATPDPLILACALAPALLMLLAAVGAALRQGAREGDHPDLWAGFRALSGLALASAVALLGLQLFGRPGDSGAWALAPLPGLAATLVGSWMAVLVQLLGTVIGVFSARYLQGEPGQTRYIAGLAGVLASVQVLLLADHWLVLIGAWALAGAALQRLLCFYPDRPFALLAAHKKQIADRAADLLLVAAALAAWREVGSGSLGELLRHVAQHGGSPLLTVSAFCLVLAVIVRTACLPVHGWLIQVMEAPTPVSALLHAGVINLGGFVLIRFAGLLEAAAPARWLLLAFGLATALLAGFVMLTRVSIKVRLAWSTVAQMGFMLLECALGLYQLAALHLLGHSLYKAHAFLAASSVVRQTRVQMLHGDGGTHRLGVFAAPLLALAAVVVVQWIAIGAVWPWWWSGLLALAWAPMFWVPAQAHAAAPPAWQRLAASFAMVALLTAAALLGHALPLGADNLPHEDAGLVTLAGMALMYVGLATLRRRDGGWDGWRRWSYAGFYVDESYTRLALRLWPAQWGNAARATTAAWPAIARHGTPGRRAT